MRKGFARVLSLHALLPHLLRYDKSIVVEMHYLAYSHPLPMLHMSESVFSKTIRVREAKTC